MKKVLIGLLISTMLVGCGGAKEEIKELSPYEINSITSLRETITDIDTWYLYYNESELAIGNFNSDKDLIKKGVIFNWTLSFDYITKNEDGLFKIDKLKEFDDKEIIFNDLDQVVSDEFIINEEVNEDDTFLGVYEIDKVTKDKVYLNVKKIVLCKGWLDLHEEVTLIEVY